MVRPPHPSPPLIALREIRPRILFVSAAGGETRGGGGGGSQTLSGSNDASSGNGEGSSRAGSAHTRVHTHTCTRTHTCIVEVLAGGPARVSVRDTVPHRINSLRQRH